MASEMFWKNQVNVSITFFTYIHHILAVDEFVAIVRDDVMLAPSLYVTMPNLAPCVGVISLLILRQEQMVWRITQPDCNS